MAWTTLEVCGGKERSRRVQWLERAACEAMEAGPEPHAKGLEDHTKPDREPLKLICPGTVSTLHAPGTVDQVRGHGHSVDWQRMAWRGLVRKLLAFR